MSPFQNDGKTIALYLYTLHLQTFLCLQIHPAYWLRPGTHETQGTGQCGAGSHALNTNATYSYPFQKKITIGCAGSSNCVEYISMFTIGGNWPAGFNYIQMEAPTGYLPGDFSRVWTFDRHTHQLQSHHGNREPIAMGTQDGNYVVGVYTPSGQDTDAPQYYGVFSSLGSHAFTDHTNKFNVVYRKRRPSHTTTFTYKTYLCIGDQHIVTDCLTKVIRQHPHI